MQRRNPHAKGTNPCFAGHMRLLTTEGYKTFRELEGKTFDIVSYDGTTSEGKVWSNGIKNTIELTTSNGKHVVCTPDHRFMLSDGTECEAQNALGERIRTFSEESVEVTAIKPFSVEEVFDFHEPNNHWGVVEGLVAHNCGEILLDDRQTCNLTEINMSAFVREDGSVDMERMLHAQRLSAKIGYRMATIELELHEWDKAGKKDMLTGCSLSGMADFLNKTQMSNEDFAAVLRKLRKVAREEVDEMAEKLKMGKTLLVTTNKPSGCWTKDHTRNFDEGILFIDEINPLIDEKEGFVDISGFHARGFNVPKTYKNELAPIHIITLKNKRELKVSPEHPLAILHEDGSENWVKAKDIVEGMQLVVELGNYKKTTNYKFNKDIKNIGPTTRMYNLPDELTPDIGYLLGAIYANGCFTTNDRIKFSCQHIPLIEKVQKIWKDVFGVEVNITKDRPGKNSSCLDFRSTLIRKFFAINGIDKNADLAAGRIPYAVRVSSAETIRQFILGYADNDGCFYANGFCIDSANKAFMQHMQEVGESVGFCFSLMENSKRKGNFGKGSIWKLGLQRQHITQELCDLVNESCWKAQDRPVTPAKRRYTKPYTVLSNILAEEEVTYDIEVEEEHWYYQGAIKSHNTLSLLPGISAGIHFQHSDYYIRRVRVNEADPLSRAMTEMGFASVPENGQTEENCSTRVFAFPCKAPAGNNKFTVSAIRQLDLYKLVMENYVDHNASNTISVRAEEWDETTQWVYDNWNSVVGMTFLELQDEFYQLAPFEKITKEQYESMLATTPKFVAEAANSMEDFSDLLAADIEECANGHCPIR